MEREDAWLQTDRLHASTGKGDPFAAAIRATRMPMIITDPKQRDNPIVFANDAFVKLCGYPREELLGTNCRFLQGPDTDREKVAAVRRAIDEKRDISIELLNYRKDGTTFWNALYVSPVVNEGGDVQFFFASQLDITERKVAELEIRAAKEHFERVFQERTADLRSVLKKFEETNAKLEETNAQLSLAVETKTALLHEVDHRVKNNLQMVSSLILLQSRTIDDEGTRRSLQEMLARIEALGTVHRRLYQSEDVTLFEVGEFVRDLVTDLAGVSVRDRITLTFDLQKVDIPAEHAAPLALIVNEVVTNALKHAFPGERKGVLATRVAREAGVLRIAVADDGVGEAVTGLSPASFGTSLVRTLSRQLKAVVAWSNNVPGTRVTIELPVAETGA